MKLKVFDALNVEGRNSAVDIFRSVAIISVVTFHFNTTLPYGDLGVDLFFVISGLLVGGLLSKTFLAGEEIAFWKFILQRGFKIWPSYYFFLAAGTLLAWVFYGNNHPEQIITGNDYKRYILFYQNYTGPPFHWSFDHVWSLCIEEHFYILLPLMFLVLAFLNPEKRFNWLLAAVVGLIIAGIVFKPISYYLTRSGDTMAGTHNRIDALAWGVLLQLLIVKYNDKIKIPKFQATAFIAGLLVFVFAIIVKEYSQTPLFQKLFFHSVIPFSFFLMLLGAYHLNFSRWKVLRLIAYYSYNWYLWHPVFVMFITDKIGNNTSGLLLYLFLSFAAAVLFTLIIEEPVMAKRKAVISKIFKEKFSEKNIPQSITGNK